MHPNHSPREYQQRRVHTRAANTDSYDFFNLLTSSQLLNDIESLLPDHRERLFPPTETLSMFLAQALSADRACQKAVNEAAIKRLAGGLAGCSTHTGAYCQARKRLPTEMVSALVHRTGQLITKQAPNAWHYQNHPVRRVDGTTVSLPDTLANQERFPQPNSQKPGLGFPLSRLVALICLGSGAVLNAAIGSCQGTKSRRL